jgi:sialate O-acetylesterase
MLTRMAARLAWSILALPMALTTANTARADTPLLNALFADHAVLQRDKPINVWGAANPGDEVTVTLASINATARADARGHWELELAALPAGGPHTLTAKTATRTQSANDVLIGDVWLCSGQSNMEFTVRNALNAGAEVADSANDRIRSLTVTRDARVAPREDFAEPVAWKIAGPTTTQDFSAVCYYFVRELQKSVDVPQGMIHSSWGGTRIEAWMSAAALRANGGYQSALDVLGEFATNKPVAFWHWGELWQKWWLSQPVTQGNQPWSKGKTDTGRWAAAPAQLGQWETWGVPALTRYDGLVWFRTHVTLTAAQARQVAKISLGAVEHTDVTWVNGRAVGSSFSGNDRVYDVPVKLLKSGDNLVVVNVHNFWGNGGLYGDANKRVLLLADGTRVPLQGWEYQIAPSGLNNIPHAPWEALNGVNVLYNGMIAPLGKYGLRGVAWYQGEANGSLGDAGRYEALLGAMFADWRKQFDAPLPFLIVQLANWGAMASQPVESGWAKLRDAQRRAVTNDGNAGLAITIDIGNRDDIHPTDKQNVGKRLARAARHVVYGEKISAWGAQPKSAALSGESVVVTLGDFEGKLSVYNSKDPSAFELCGVAAGSCRYVRAQLSGDGKVTLESGLGAEPTRVRFCWADSPLCNLYDSAGLPVGPFEIEVK